MSYLDAFDSELKTIVSGFNNGLSNTSTNKYKKLVKVVSAFTQVDEKEIYITSAYTRSSNLWNRLAQGKPLNRHYELAICLINENDLSGGIASAKRFIGEGNAHYYAIGLAVYRNQRWEIAAFLDSNKLPIFDKIQDAFPGIEIKHERRSLSDSAQQIELQYAFYVGAVTEDETGMDHDYSDEFIEKGVWTNGWDDKFVDMVNSMQVGDRIAMKAAFTQKNGLPFDNKGKTVSAMRIKAIGSVIENSMDGKHLKVEWSRLDPPKTWYGLGNLRQAVHKVNRSDGIVKEQLLDFTFGDVKQDYSICEEYYSEDSQDTGYEIVKPNLQMPDDLDNNGDFVSQKDKTIFGIIRSPRNKNSKPLNTIIYGAPGTGKTHSTAEYALAIIEDRPVDLSYKTIEERKKMMDLYNNLVKSGQIVFTTFHQNYGYEDFVQGLRPDFKSEKLSFKNVDGVFKEIADRALYDTAPNKRYVLVIDEINRANISKVFGELITLIEDDKRWGEVNQSCVTLQSGDVFAVPNNLYIVGTMNSADKSISLIDAALRRRFVFIEQRPDAELITDSELKKVFVKLNNVLAQELDSSDLLIGHSYFMGKVIDDLIPIMNNSIVPLLYEYFYDKKKKVMSVLKDILKDTGYEPVDPVIGRIFVKKGD